MFCFAVSKQADYVRNLVDVHCMVHSAKAKAKEPHVALGAQVSHP